MKTTVYSTYFEEKKLRGLILTGHNLNPERDCNSLQVCKNSLKPIEYEGISRWSKLSGRYREADEQREFLLNGCRDTDPGPVEHSVRECAA